MSISKDQLVEYVIEPILRKFNLFSESALNLLLATCAQESNMGSFIHQIKGPGLGIYSIEPFTFEDLTLNVIYGSKRKWSEEIQDCFGFTPSILKPDVLIHNLAYSTLLCRLQYWRYLEELPKANDIEGMFAYWKKYYNRNPSKGTKEEFVRNYNQYVLKK